MLTRLVYYSRSLIVRSPQEVENIASLAWERNSEAGISGLIMHVDGWFLQLLEGERAAVSEAFHTLSQDYRHCEVTLVSFTGIDERLFPTTPAALVTPRPECPLRMQRFGKAGTFNPTVMSEGSILALFGSFAGEERILKQADLRNKQIAAQ